MTGLVTALVFGCGVLLVWAVIATWAAFSAYRFKDTRAVQCQHLHADAINGDRIAERALGLLKPGEKPPGLAFCWECRTWLTSVPFTWHADTDHKLILEIHA